MIIIIGFSIFDNKSLLIKNVSSRQSESRRSTPSNHQINWLSKHASRHFQFLENTVSVMCTHDKDPSAGELKAFIVRAAQEHWVASR